MSCILYSIFENSLFIFASEIIIEETVLISFNSSTNYYLCSLSNYFRFIL